MTLYLTENKFAYPVDHLPFTGWATSLSGKVAKQDNASQTAELTKTAKPLPYLLLGNEPLSKRVIIFPV